MKWNTWSYFKNVLLILIQGILLTILSHPWLQLISLHWPFSLTKGVFWVFFTTLSGMVVLKRSAGRGKDGLLAIVGGGVLVPLILGLFLNLSFYLILPYTLILLYMGTRYCDYPRRISFATDWGWGSLFMVIFSLLGETLGYELGLLQILIFFVLGVLGVILWNATALEEEGLEPNYAGLSRSIAIFVLGVGSLSLALGVLISPSLLQKIMGILRSGYNSLMDALVFLIVRPFAWLLSPLFRWAANVEKHQLPMQIPELERIPNEQLFIENGISPEALEAATWSGWAFFVVVLFFVAWVALRKILKSKSEEATGVGLETRESVFSQAEMLEDLKGALRNLMKPLSRFRQPKWYKGEDPLLLIRTLYARFALKASKKTIYQVEFTPSEYAQKFSSVDEKIDHEAIHNLTTIYNEARYGEIGDHEAVNRAEKAFSKVW